MILMIACRQLYGDFGDIPPNGQFRASEEQALSLESRGLAWRSRPPLETGMKPVHVNKMYAPKGNK